jgi:pyruvate formate-lyase/glycerol dehydratase family glycyl radical enzyme
MTTRQNLTPAPATLRQIKAIKLTERVVALRDAYFSAVPELCTERALGVTRESQDLKLFAKPGRSLDDQRITSLDKARLYRRLLEGWKPVVWHEEAIKQTKVKDRKTGEEKREMVPFPIKHHSLFAGSTTNRFKGVPLYPEFIATWIWPELELLKEREQNPYYITDQQVKALNEVVFPYWTDKNITELARARSRIQTKKKSDPLEFRLLERLVYFLTTKPNCISHTIPSFENALNKGLDGIIAEAKQKASTAADELKRDFYSAIAEAMAGVVAYSRNLAEKADELAKLTQDPTEKDELQKLADIHRRIPAQKAETFREGLTTVWMCWIALHLENANAAMSLGRLDQFLYELYKKDIDSGRMTREQAVELLACFWLKIGDHVPMVPSTGEKLFGGSGSNQAITIGGVDKEGEDAVNELTYVILRVTELMLLRDPNLNARYHPDKNSRDYLRRLCEVNLNTAATPALHNDRAVIQVLTQTGETLEQARDYGIVGCVEPISNGRTYGHTGAILLNLVSALELTLFSEKRSVKWLDRNPGDPEAEKDLKTDYTQLPFEEFKGAFLAQAEWLVEQTVKMNELFGRIHQDFYPTPILSSLFEGPMAKGKDLIFGGATLNSSGVAIIGFADVVDSLAAIERHVDSASPTLTFKDFLVAMRNDFAGEKDRRLYALLRNPDRTPKFGNGDARADAIAAWLAEELDKLYAPYVTYRGGHYRVGYWSMTNHAGFGKLSGATPNGRRKGESFASGITPVSGMNACLTQALESVAGLPLRFMPNGMAFNVKFPPVGSERYREAMLAAFTDLVFTYFQGSPGKNSHGGMEIQFNVTSREDFIEAQKNPDAYPELLVRVSGYTAYFKDLNPQMQKEIIERTEYGLLPQHVVNIAAKPRVEDDRHPKVGG